MEPGCVGCAIDRWPDVAVALGACFRHARLPRPQTDRGGAGADVTGSDVGDVHLARLSLTAVSAVSPGAYLPAAVGTPSPSQLPARPRAFRCNFSGSGWCGVVRVARRAPCQKVGDRGGAGGQGARPLLHRHGGPRRTHCAPGSAQPEPRHLECRAHPPPTLSSSCAGPGLGLA